MWRERLREVEAQHAELTQRLSDPAVLADPAQLRELSRAHARLEEILRVAQALDRVERELAGARDVLAEATDPELRALAEAEVERLESEQEAQRRRLEMLLVPRDPLDDRNAVLEIRAGTGGEEAALFAADLLRMYTRFAERRGWSVELVSRSESDLGGIKEAILLVRGPDAYGTLRHESGVHRVQRVPVTESAGRIHTSAATVAVLPEAEEIDVEIREEDLRIDVFRSSGPGGQSVNTTDSAVRITHLPTGLVVTCQDEKSQHKNRERALAILRARLLDRMVAEQEAARARERRLQVGTGDRSAKIRTYNFPQNRVTDHRIGYTAYNLGDVLDGELDELVERLRLARLQERAA